MESVPSVPLYHNITWTLTFICSKISAQSFFTARPSNSLAILIPLKMNNSQTVAANNIFNYVHFSGKELYRPPFVFMWPGNFHPQRPVMSKRSSSSSPPPLPISICLWQKLHPYMSLEDAHQCHKRQPHSCNKQRQTDPFLIPFSLSKRSWMPPSLTQNTIPNFLDALFYLLVKVNWNW